MLTKLKEFKFTTQYFRYQIDQILDFRFKIIFELFAFTPKGYNESRFSQLLTFL